MKVGYLTIEGSVKDLKGVGRYTSELIKHLGEGIFYDIYFSGSPKRIKAFTEVPKQVKNSEADIYHATIPDLAPVVSILHSNIVVTFHDLIPYYAWRQKTFKGIFGLGARLWASTALKRVARGCKKIIVPSKQTFNELQDAFGISEDKINIIPEGVSDFLHPTDTECKYILFFANFSGRKRVDLAIKAYREFCEMVENPPKLMLVGGHTRTRFQKQFDVDKLIEGIEDKVIIKGKVSDDELLELYNESYCSLFPSDYEGFGLPILESSRCKTVPIVREESNITGEVKDCAVTVPTEEIPKKMVELVNNKSKRKKLADKLYDRSLKYTWDKTAKKTMEVYEEAIG